MTSRISRFLQTVWSAATGRKPSPAETPSRPEVVLHDPAAQRPHDLDDPYFDPKVQARIAEVIANATRKK